MNEKTMNGKKAFKIALPVILGLVLVLLITLTVSIVSRPDFNASLENPKDAYLKLEDYVITNEKMYINLRYNYGVSDMVTYVDKILLKDIKVDRNSEEYLEVKNKLIYGEDHEKLTATEKAELLEEYETNLKIAGYKTEEAVNAHFDLEYKRTVYAKQAYKEWVKENPYDDETLESAYLEMNAAKYNDSVDAIVVTFDSEKEALAVLEMFGVDAENLSSSQNWINKEKNAQRLAWLEEIEELKAKVESAANGAEKDVLNAKIAEIEKDILALGVKNINNIVYFTELEIQQIFVDMYNFMNAFFNGGDVSKYYDENGKLNPKYNILVEDVHYEVVEKEINENDEKVTKKVVQIIGNVEEAKKNANCKLTYTEEEAKAINSTLNTALFTTLKLGEDYDFRESYTRMPSGFSDGSAYFLAVLLGKYEAPDLEYDFFDEEDDDLTDPGQELLDEITAYLVEEKFDDNIVTQMLLELRAKNGLVIYDNYIEAAYKAAWDYLYGTTLKIKDYPEYTVNKKNSKTLVFTLTPENGETIEMNVQDFFELLNEAHGPQTALSMMSNYFVLSNPEFNKLYNHVTGEIYDKEAFKDAVANELKNIKYYFNAGYYASSGFDASYGWNNFLRDYLRMDDEYELILNAAGMEDAFKKFYETQYTYESVLEEMKEIWENDYYALSVINVIVFTDYNHDGSADNYELDEEKVNEFWTEEQEALAKELIEKIYAAAPATGEDGLYKQLVAVVKEYNEATYNDEVWGKFKQVGLKVKPEAAQDYTNKSSLVQEFLDKMAEVYNDIEREGRTGIEFDAPYLVEGSFVTSYGYHKIAITKTTDRTYVTEEVDKTLGYEELRDSQLALLTENVYNLYLEMQEDDYEDNKEEILKELGFDADYKLDDKLKKAIETYYVPAVEALEDEHAMDIVFSNIRETAVKNGVYVFTNAADKEYYFEVETIVRADLEKEHADHE